jgi:hypothetical protein
MLTTGTEDPPLNGSYGEAGNDEDDVLRKSKGSRSGPMGERKVP